MGHITPSPAASSPYLLGLSESDLQRITVSPLGADSALGGLLTPLLSRLVDTAGTYPQRAGELIARNVVDLVQTLAEDRLGRDGGDTADAARLSLVRIRAYIDRHLAHPDLTPDSIARAHHISVRYLHKLFALEDITVSRWIQQRRLEQCRRDPARREVAHLTIAAVAHRWGFTSASHFSRVFRAAYGVSLPDAPVEVAHEPARPLGAERVGGRASRSRRRTGCRRARRPARTRSCWASG
ncbi:helix-turn-helix domain-containing protein [Streptomyces sp. NPDC005890]|uniref:helix-turn-helix domain-containing protein n=1 Tax=Streptomyces sp. NPDC005890 TaxID=3154568 RepID=UPI0033E642AE